MLLTEFDSRSEMFTVWGRGRNICIYVWCPHHAHGQKLKITLTQAVANLLQLQIAEYLQTEKKGETNTAVTRDITRHKHTYAEMLIKHCPKNSYERVRGESKRMAACSPCIPLYSDDCVCVTRPELTVVVTCSVLNELEKTSIIKASQKTKTYHTEGAR